MIAVNGLAEAFLLLPAPTVLRNLYPAEPLPDVDYTDKALVYAGLDTLVTLGEIAATWASMVTRSMACILVVVPDTGTVSMNATATVIDGCWLGGISVSAFNVAGSDRPDIG